MMLRRWWAGLVLGICMLFCASPVLAQRVLMLTTDAGGGANSPLEEAEFTNLRKEFSDVVGAGNVARVSTLFTANGISQATFNPPEGPYDIVVVASHYRAIHATNWAVLSQAVANRWASSVVFFVDGYSSLNSNDAQMLALLNANTGRNFALGALQAAFQSFPLNTNSAYSASFSGLDPVYGGYFDYINNVPGENALYLANGTPNTSFPAPGSTALVNGVYALLVPVAQSNQGRGACLFATVDVTSFRDADIVAGRNGGKIAQAFVRAVTDANGACGLPTVSKGFDRTGVLLGGSGNTAQLTIQFSNASPEEVLHAKVTDVLPVPLVISGTITHTCTGGTPTGAVGGSTVVLDDFGIPATTGCSLTVPVAWPNTAAGRAACADPVARTVTNTIRSGVDFMPARSGADATATLTCQPGTLSVGKTVAWNAGSQPVDLTGASFPVSVSCTGTDGVAVPAITGNVVLSTPTSGSVSVVTAISSGSCTVAETSRPAAPAGHQWVEATAPSASIALQAPPGNAMVALTNTLARSTAAIALAKNVTGGPSGGISASFGFTANCGADGSFNGSVALAHAASGTGSIANVPQGASCSVAENTPLPAAPANYAWGATPAAVPVTVAASGNAASFTNTLTRSTASIGVTINVAGTPSGGMSGSFGVTAHCGADGTYAGTVVMANGFTATGSIAGLPQGAVCTVGTDPSLPAPPAQHAWSTALPPDVAVTVAASGNSASFTVALVPAAGPAPVPALEPWMRMLLAVLLAAMSAPMLRRVRGGWAAGRGRRR